MSDPSETKPETKSGSDWISEVLKKGKLPNWALLLLILFGSGGVAYKAYDYYSTHHVTKTYDASVTLPDLQVTASFFPGFDTAMQTSFVVNAKNIAEARSVPNLRMLIDAGAAKIVQCAPRTSARGASLDKISEDMYAMTLPRLGPVDEADVYCIGEGIGALKVRVAAKEDSGTDVGSREFQFNRETSKPADTTNWGFSDFLLLLLEAILVVLVVCIMSVLFGLTGKLFRRWKLYHHADK